MDYRDLEAGNNSDYFWFRGKTNLIQTFMEKIMKGKKDIRILNIGAGTGDDLKMLKEFGDNYVVDIDAKALEYVPNELCVEKREADACNLPYDDNTFDVVISCDCFEHIEDHHKAIREVYRTLKPGGILLFTVPAFQSLFSSHDKALYHFRRYNKKTLREAFKIFPKKKFYFWNTLMFPAAALSRIIRRNAPPRVDNPKVGKFMNLIMFGILRIDNILIKNGLSMPAGLSLTGYCFK